MKVIVMTVSDRRFFPGTLATVNSVYRFHGDEYEVVVVDNGLIEPQRKLLRDGGVRLLPAAEAAGERYAGPWELKAHAARALAGGCDVLVGIDSDCVLAAPIGDVVAAAAETGRWYGGKDGDGQHYGDDYGVYGIDVPAFNGRYMSTSLYVCAATPANRAALDRWSSHCDRAVFNGRGPYPGHGDQGVLNAVLYAAGRGDDVELLPNELWSQHWVYWESTIVVEDGVPINVTYDGRPQRAIHVGGTEKFWSTGHQAMLASHPKRVTNYAWFLSLLWFGRCGDWSVDPHDYIPTESHHVIGDLARHHHLIVAAWPGTRERWTPSAAMLERMAGGTHGRPRPGEGLGEHLRLARLVPIGGRIAYAGSCEDAPVAAIAIAIAVLHREVVVYSVEPLPGDGNEDGDARRPSGRTDLDEARGRFPHLRLISTPGRSGDVSRLFPDGFFDLVFVGAAPDPTAAEQEVRQWMPKLRPGGGTIAGNGWERPPVRGGVEAVFAGESVSVAEGVWSVKAAGTRARQS
jgi:hypothetical protein